MPVLNSYLATRSASKRLPPEAMVPCFKVSACESTSAGSTLVTGMPLAYAVMAASMAAALPGQSGAPPGVVAQQ
ncbi:MAG: hypothetical protein E6K49_05380 [Gammaproteobacteria bacterium]|nr:MAG: hypothetical protein E6K49_05380 [Gammaproteobacteria bacterium]